MPFQQSFSTDIKEINKLLEESNEKDALSKFQLYVNSIEQIGPYDKNIWLDFWRKDIWEFGRFFKLINPGFFISLIDAKLESSDKVTREVFEFIKSEIIVNYLPSEECKRKLEELIITYPLNPEFRHTLGLYLYSERKYKEAISHLKLAIKIDPRNKTFLDNCFNVDIELITESIHKGEYAKGVDIISNILSEKIYKLEYQLTTLRDYNARLEDFILFQNKLKTLEFDFKERMNDSFEKERTRVIEILGFFSAIVAFILTTVSISKNFSFVEALYFVMSLGLILLLFTVSISILFTTTKKKLFNDIKFWILAVGIVLQLALIIFIQS